MAKATNAWKARRRIPLTITAISALALTACGSGGGDGDSTASGDGGSISVYNCEPQFLMPGNSTEVCGSKMLEQLFTGLTTVDYETNEAGPGVATEWDSNEDQTEWTFDLGEGWTFHNGDEITAQTFVDTFNWNLDPENTQQNASFYDVFVGYDDVVDGNTDELAGITAIDDYTLKFETNEPFSPLPLMLSYTGFYPLPQAAFDDPSAFEQAPIGNGQYQMDGEWVHDVEVNMTRYEDWGMESTDGPDYIEWRIYNDVDTAYTDVQAGELDILDQVPPNRLGSVEGDFGDNWTEFDTASYEYFGFPLYQDEFENPEIRRALSMAIDRDLIIDNIYDGARTKAEGIIPPMLPAAGANECDACEFDPEAAAELYEEAGGPSELTYFFNSGAGHESYVEAISNMWMEHLPVDNVTFRSLDFAQYLDLQDANEITGPYRLGWALSYPSPQYAMEPIYTTGASSNHFGYSNPEFDELIARANSADPEEADALYQQAEAILLEDLPGAPLWFRPEISVHTDRIANDSIVVDLRSFMRVEQIKVNN